MSKNEAITICIGEDAFKYLKITLVQNIKYFDNYIVINNFDKNVNDLVRSLGGCVLNTNSMFENGKAFDKGAGYNEAFKKILYKDYVTILDCDCFIPDDLGSVLKKLEFDKEFMYGSRRVVIEKISDFFKIINGDKSILDSLNCPYGIGYVYMQLFNVNSDVIKRHGLNHPNNHDESESDWMFRNRFGETFNSDMEYRGKLKEIKERIYHLGPPNMRERNHDIFFNN